MPRDRHVRRIAASTRVLLHERGAGKRDRRDIPRGMCGVDADRTAPRVVAGAGSTEHRRCGNISDARTSYGRTGSDAATVAVARRYRRYIISVIESRS